MSRTALRIALAFLAAVAVAAAFGSVAQSQHNLAAITGLGVEVPVLTWVRVTAEDLLWFAPLYAVLVTAALAVALPAAAALARRAPVRRPILFALAGGCGIVAAILVINAVAPMTPIAATRQLTGALALGLGGALGGWTYAALTRSARAPRAPSA